MVVYKDKDHTWGIEVKRRSRVSREDVWSCVHIIHARLQWLVK